MPPLHPIDGYLLDSRPAKKEAVAAALADRQTAAGAQPFYRALDLLGSNVADEALMALRLALAGLPVDDDNVRRLRAHLTAAKAGDPSARAAYLAMLETA